MTAAATGSAWNPTPTLVGSLSDLSTYVKEHGTDVIFIALPIRHVKRVMNLLDDLRDTTASIYYVPDVFVFDLIQARSGEIHGIPVVAMCETPFYGYRGVTKRLTDIVLSVVILLLFLPLLLLIAVLVKLSSPGPVIFKQRRYGLDGQEIAVYKFRTMTVTEDGDADPPGIEVRQPHHPHRRILRRASLDELPQLINVLQGRMSLVGPAPARGGAQRGIPQTHQGLHGAPQGAARHHGARAGERLPRRDLAARGDGGARQLRPRLPQALDADAGHQDHPADRGEDLSRRQGLLNIIRGGQRQARRHELLVE